MLLKSRLYTGENISLLQEKFMKRKDEISELLKLVEKIKKYIKQNKSELLKKKGEDERKIYEIKLANKPKEE